jgi:hypothetical protein
MVATATLRGTSDLYTASDCARKYQKHDFPMRQQRRGDLSDIQAYMKSREWIISTSHQNLVAARLRCFPTLSARSFENRCTSRLD